VLANAVDPAAGKIDEGAKVFGCGEPPRFEPAHLTRRRCAAFRRFATDDPAHRRIVT